MNILNLCLLWLITLLIIFVPPVVVLYLFGALILQDWGWILQFNSILEVVLYIPPLIVLTWLWFPILMDITEDWNYFEEDLFDDKSRDE